ncbi:MAG: hypothetical protein EHM23_28525 [Acidobacteria bacterium]|nr:MAG: hypothetical protein EHM23_28525 [Acidobacteriota bacterium]
MTMTKDAAPSVEEVQTELQKILESEAFSRADRSRQFLQYVCELTLKGESSRINQYLIGFEVFRRGPDYSTEDDSLVRRQARVLRQRLDAYYGSEGQSDPVRIKLPLGHYVPVFERQVAVSSEKALPPASRTGSLTPLLSRIAVVLLLAMCCGLAGWFIGRSSVESARTSAPGELSGAVREIWGDWLDDPAGATICFSNSMAAVVNPQAKPLTSPDLPRWLAGPEAERSLRQIFKFPFLKYIYLTPNEVNTKMGEAIGAVRLASLFTRSGGTATATESRLLTWQSFREQNLILLGHNEHNRWIDPLLTQYPLRLGQRGERAQRYILNMSPREGEPPEYQVHYPEGSGSLRTEPTLEYALISMIPGIVPGRKLLLINGLDTQATQMAVGFLVDPQSAETLLARLRAAAPQHEGAWYFQAVVETDVRDKVPLGARVVAVRSSDAWPRPREAEIAPQAVTK